MNFDWGDHRKARWVRLCAAMLGDQDRAEALTALLNLSSGYATDETSIPAKVLQDGWVDRIEPLLPEVRPRIICALTNRVWNAIVQAPLGAARQIENCPFGLARLPVALRIPGCTFESVVVKPHHHPSRFLRNEQIDKLGRACEWLLQQLS